jgi:trans-aconitate methyltransferase
MVLNQTYYRNVNPDLLDRIPLNAKTVVEVGCGSGALGGAYKLRNPQVQYIGVEAMAEPAADASKVLDQVIVGNAEDPLLLGNYVQDFDCLVYGDVLEHLVNPWDCLSRWFSCCLHPQRSALVSHRKSAARSVASRRSGIV